MTRTERCVQAVRCVLPRVVCGGCVAIVMTGCATRMPARSFVELQSRLKGGSTVYVIDSTGTETRGKVVELSPSTLTLDVDRVQRRLEQASVRQVQTYGDPLWNGLLIGMAVATPGMLIADPTYDPCPDNPQRRCANSQVGQRLVAIGTMGAIGAGIDALIRGRHQIYLAPDQSTASARSTPRVSVTAGVGRSTGVVLVTVRR